MYGSNFYAANFYASNYYHGAGAADEGFSIIRGSICSKQFKTIPRQNIAK